tara:strand:+ start:1430 stop:1936 length:507 start_codon:yes stop_codon:yes gene_type:complete
MIRFVFSLFAFSALCFQFVTAQSFEWAYVGEASESSLVHDVIAMHNYVSERALDNEGNIIRVGIYKGTKDFDPGQDEYLLTDPSLFGFSGFIQKIDPDGNLIWAKSMGISECSRAHQVALDTDGNIFVYGEFKDSVDADPGIGEFMLYSPNINSQLFILKLDSEGDFV